ncbi:MAG: hypothetical protein ABL995_15490 [Bryobacteraceae bacterium]
MHPRFSSRGFAASVAATAAFVFAIAAPAAPAAAQTSQPNLDGVYRVIPSNAVAAGRKNSGSPSEIKLLPEAAARAKSADLKEDPARMCQPVGPFRMMARENNKIEIATTSASVFILFEDVARGLLQKVDFNRDHIQSDNPDEAYTWMGDGIARWDRGTLVVETTGFNDSTWLNELGAPHSEALKVIERFRPLADGRFLEVTVTAEDPKTLAKPYTYTRYFEKTDSEIAEDICEYQE